MRLVRSVVQRASRARDDQSGSVTPFVLIVTIALLMLAGLVIDGGRQLSSRSRAFAYAQESARAGAQTLDLTKDAAIVDEQDAMRAAEQFCTQAMSEDDNLVECVPKPETGQDESGAKIINVRVDTTVETDGILSGMFGVETWSADGVAIARPVQGIIDPESGQLKDIPPPETAGPTGNPFPTDDDSPPTEETPSCEKPMVDPHHPNQTWEPGDKPLKPPPTEPSPGEIVPCWPPWEPPKKKPNKPPDNGPGNNGPGNNGQGNNNPNGNGR